MKVFTTLNSCLTIFEDALLHEHFVRNCLIVAAAIRLCSVLIFNTQPVSDFEWYYDRGVEIAQGNGYSVLGVPTAYWPVGYPGMLGILFKLIGPSLIVPKLLNVVFSTVLVFLVYRLSKMLFHSELSARTSMLALALYPNHVAYSSLLSAELLFSFLMIVSTILLITKGHISRNAILSGVVGGVALLTKPQFLFVPAIIIACMAISRSGGRGWMKYGVSLALVYLSMIAVILPWTIRNFEVVGAWPIVSLNGGVNLLIGNNPHATGTYIYNQPMKLITEGAKSEYERDSLSRAYAIDYIRNNPWTVAKTVPLKVLHMFKSDSYGWRWNKNAFPVATGDDYPRIGSRFLLATDGQGRAGWIFLGLIALSEGYYAVILLLFIISLIRLCWRRNRTNVESQWTIGLWIIVYWTCVIMVFFGSSRFHFPIMPLVMVYVGALFSGKGRTLDATVYRDTPDTLD